VNKDILICGVGGQGTVLASRIIAAAAMETGDKVCSAETIGMAQRGGSVTSHVRIGEEAYSPLIPFGSADLMLAFEPAEAVRNLKYLKKNGTAVVNSAPVKPVTEALNETGYDGKEMTEYLKDTVDCIFVDSDEVMNRFGSAKYLNIVILGAALGARALGIDRNTVTGQIRKRVKSAYLEANLEALRFGCELGSAAKRSEKSAGADCSDDPAAALYIR